MNALLLLIIIIGVSIQQIAKKAYNKVATGAFSFSAASALIAVTTFIVTAGGKLNFNTGVLKYSVPFAIAYSLAAVCSFLAIKTGSLSLTSLIIQYSLVIPAFYGLIALGEARNLSMVIGIILLLISLALINIGGKKDETKITFKWALFAFLSFVGNGSCSVIQKVQQLESGGLYKSELMIIAYLITVVTLMCCAFGTEKKATIPNLKKGFVWYFICGLANGVVNFLVLVMSTRMAASLMFPVISAGGIVATVLVAITIYKEKLTFNQKIALILGLAAIIILNI